MVASNPRRVLIVANRTSGTPALLDEVRRRARSGSHQFTLLVPDAAYRSAADWTRESALPLLTGRTRGWTTTRRSKSRQSGATDKTT
jgi:broad specificity phosphatase PhoE